MKDTIEYRILRYLSENDNVEPIEVSHLHSNKKFLIEKLYNLKKEKYIKCRVVSVENIIAKLTFCGLQYFKELEKVKQTIITENCNNGNNNENQLSRSVLANPTIQNASKTTETTLPKSSNLEIASYLLGIVVAIIAIYEFILKKI